jgi:hypothetical protein
VLLVALLVSEPVTNCLKHTFKDGKGLGKTIINGLAAQQMQDEADKGVKTRNSGESGYVADQEKPGSSAHAPGRPDTAPQTTQRDLARGGRQR